MRYCARMVVDLEVTLHPGQQRAQDSTAKVIGVIAGTGGGKTAYTPLWIITERAKLAERTPPITQSSGIVVAPYKILRRTTMPTILRLLQTKLHLGEWESRQDGIWRFYDGGYIYFCSADTPESIEGAHVHWAVLDEAGQRQFPQESFRAAERRVRFHEGRILITTTPYVLGWLKDLGDASLLDEDDPAARKDVEIITFPSIENPRFPKDEYARAERTLPPWMFKMFYQGLWDRPAGLVYSMIEDKHWVNFSDLHEHWDRWPVYAGFDFGYHSPTAGVYATVSPEGIIYIFDEYYATERTNAQNARHAPHKDKILNAWGDPAGPEAIAEFAHQHWRMTGAPRKNVLEGLKTCFELILSGGVFFVRGRLTELSNEHNRYVWDDNPDHPDQVMKVYDHACDALRYMLTGMKAAGLTTLATSTLPEINAPSPGRMAPATQQDPGLWEPGQEEHRGIHLGTRASHRSRLTGLPRRIGR